MTPAIYGRDISYIPKDVPINDNTLATMTDIAGPVGTISCIAQAFFRSHGMQLRVDKAVSDDLNASDSRGIYPKDVAWPSKAVEFVYEDPAIPSILLLWLSRTETLARFGNLERAADYDYRLIALAETTTGVQMTVNLWGDALVESLDNDTNIPLPAGPAGTTVSLSDEESNTLLAMTRLALKVLAYTSLDRFEYVPVETVTRRMGSKVGYKGRPPISVRRVTYMPSIHSPRPENETAAPGTRRFMGRRGYFRFFRHERYVHMKGRFIYVPPIHVDGASRQVGIVRKTN
jgi:hypothetical protein